MHKLLLGRLEMIHSLITARSGAGEPSACFLLNSPVHPCSRLPSPELDWEGQVLSIWYGSGGSFQGEERDSAFQLADPLDEVPASC